MVKLYILSPKVFLFLLPLGLLIGCADSEEKNDLPPPNILWIVSEDNSPLLGCYGDEFATTPHLDALAQRSVLYENAYATAPVCAPARSSLITGMYPTALGTQHMRSTNRVPDFVQFFPKYLKEKGYFTTNNYKKDYNTIDQPACWDESSRTATYENREPGQPFFAIFNLGISHESRIHKWRDSLWHDPDKVPIPPYHPNTPEVRHDWAQYHDQVQMMDEQVGDILQKLEENDLADSTIVFYYSDHGGVLGRSKRFLFESGLHVPLIVHAPKAYQHLMENKSGERTDRLVSFVDFAPTILSLVGIEPPAHIQGKAFLGKYKTEPREYVVSARGRMDERTDCSRSIRDKRFRYTRNYMPHKKFGEYLEYLWRAPSMQSWEEEYREGRLNEIQSVFFEKKPFEELYDVENDPHNVHNLADDPTFENDLKRLRNALDDWASKSLDAGLWPEAEMISGGGDSTIFDFVQSNISELKSIDKVRGIAAGADPENLPALITEFKNKHSAVRFWAATGCVILGEKAVPAKPGLLQLLNDESPSVAIAAAQSLFYLGERKKALEKLSVLMGHDQLMVRVEANNAIDALGDGAKLLLPRIKELVRDKKDRAYDNRGYNGLLEKLSD